jgi:hypothetical protein
MNDDKNEKQKEKKKKKEQRTADFESSLFGFRPRKRNAFSPFFLLNGKKAIYVIANAIVAFLGLFWLFQKWFFSRRRRDITL